MNMLLTLSQVAIFRVASASSQGRNSIAAIECFARKYASRCTTTRSTRRLDPTHNQSSSRLECSYYQHRLFQRIAFSPLLSPRNKYDSFRGLTALNVHTDENSFSESKHVNNETTNRAQIAVSVLAQKSRTWKRLSSIVELATAPKIEKNSNKILDTKSIADIGCDHGLLAIALAASGQFDKVIGADISHRALNDGAMSFYRKVMEILEIRNFDESTNSRESAGMHTNIEDILPVEFRVGDGLQALNPGEANAICIAGMGAETMMSILESQIEVYDDEDVSSPASQARQKNHLDYLGTQSLFLQSISRPRLLMQLYSCLQDKGWQLSGERIIYLKKRWYITSAFDRVKDGDQAVPDKVDTRLPGHFLSTSLIEREQKEYIAYVNHHLQWLNKDFESRGGQLEEDDIIWRDANILLIQ